MNLKLTAFDIKSDNSTLTVHMANKTYQVYKIDAEGQHKAK